MLTRFDDYPIHQTSLPIAHTASADLNHYDRYFFNGYDSIGSLYFGVALGLYPNRRVHDAAVSIVLADGPAGARRQVSLFASATAPVERDRATHVGPIEVDVVEPLRTLRVVVDSPEHAIAADLTFTARTEAVEEPRFVWAVGAQLVFDYTRLTQWGTWSGWFELDGVRTVLAEGEIVGSRDRSWGVRPVGDRPPGAAPVFGQFYWVWAPANFPDGALHVDVNEDADGRRWHEGGCVVPLTGPAEHAVGVDYDLAWRSGTRQIARFETTVHRLGGASVTARYEPIFDFQMAGLGYGHPYWRHGTNHGAAEAGREEIALPVTDPPAPHHVHVQTLCRVTRDDGVVGVGIVETLAVGPHRPTGLTGLLDGFGAG